MLLLGAPLMLASGDEICQGVVLEVQEESLIVRSQQVELAFSVKTGTLSAIRHRESGGVLLSTFPDVAGLDLLVGGKWLCQDQGAVWVYYGHRTRREDDCGVLELDQRAGDWLATSTYRLEPAGSAVRRDVTLTYTGTETPTVRLIRFVLDGMGLPTAADAQYSLPSNWPPFTRPLRDLTPGRRVHETGGTMSGHFVHVHSESAGVGIVATMVCDTEGVTTSVIEQQGNVRVLHEIGSAFKARPGKPETFGSQLIAVTRGTWRHALRQARDLYRLVGLRLPEDRLAAARGTVFYSAHPGGTIDSGFQDVGGFREFAASLPDLKRLGINTLWLLPFWKGHVYAPTDYYALDPRLGTEADLKALVDQAHSLGIRVLGDLIPHGPLEESGLAREHRDWVSTNEDGTMQYWWGCLSCDYAHPGWQEYMGDHAAHWVRVVGLDGYRVDCAGGGPPNWRPYGDNRPTMSGLYGGLGVLKVAREKMEAVKEHPLLLAEAAGPPFLRYADFYYDWPFLYDVTRAYLTMPADEYVPLLARWLENQQYWLPEGANLMRCLENHDTVRARMVYGPGPERALMALCALAPGSPMVYHFQEVGMAPYLARLYEVRRALPELTAGEADFVSAKCNCPEVLVFSRSLGDQRCLVAINFEAEERNATITLPAEWDGLEPATRDALFGVPIRDLGQGQVQVLLPPLGVALITERQRQVPPLPSHETPERPALDLPEVEEHDGDVIVHNGPFTLTIGRDNGGLIRSLTDREGNPLLRCLSFEEGQRRLWLGAERLSVGSRPVSDLRWERKGDTLVVKAQGSLVRRAGGFQEPVMDYAITYSVERLWAVDVSYELTARKPVSNVLGSLRETLQLDPQATEWYATTAEGFLHDWAIPRWPRDTRYSALYLHGIGDRVWQSRDIPMHPSHRWFGAKSPSGWWTVLSLLPQGDGRAPDNVMLKMRLGETSGPHVVMEWLDGNRPVKLAVGETLHLRYQIRIENTPRAAIQAICEGSSVGQSGPVSMRVRGTRYEFSNGIYKLALTRFGGGRIADLRLCGDPEPLINSSMVYTDGGIYGDITTPDMRQVRAFVSNNNDPECDLRVEPQPQGYRVTCEGFLRGQDGRGIPSPRTRYRVTYVIDGSPSLRVTAAVKTSVPISDARAFLAQTLSLPRFRSFLVNAERGVEAGTPEPGAERVWESKRRGFGAEPWMVCSTGTGRGLRVAGSDLASALQNAFLLRSGDDEGVVFLAFNDFEPADIPAVWRQVEYTLTPLKEEL